MHASIPLQILILASTGFDHTSIYIYIPIYMCIFRFDYVCISVSKYVYCNVNMCITA